MLVPPWPCVHGTSQPGWVSPLLPVAPQKSGIVDPRLKPTSSDTEASTVLISPDLEKMNTYVELTL